MGGGREVWAVKKKVKYRAIEKIRSSEGEVRVYSVWELCGVIGVKRGAYYKQLYREERRNAREKLIVEIVKSIRHYLPRLGTKKLRAKVSQELLCHGFKVPGRDRFFAILREHGLLLERRKSSVPRTTYSGHNYAIQPNLLKDLFVTGPLQAFVSDITYIRVGDSFAYLFLTTDIFSRKIVGFYLSENLDHRGAIASLSIAVQGIKEPKGIIHHSDRGVQYCCHDFLDALHGYNMRSSMTDADHCAQNALAECMNGILKTEFYLDSHFLTFEMARRAVHQSIVLYNEERPHGSLKMKTPYSFHAEALAA